MKKIGRRFQQRGGEIFQGLVVSNFQGFADAFEADKGQGRHLLLV